MKMYYKKLGYIVIIILLFGGCNNHSTKNTTSSKSNSISKSDSGSEKKELMAKPDTNSEIKSDSIELTALMRNLYKWHETEIHINYDKWRDFPTTATDSFFTGIDWNDHKERMADLEKTNFFSKEFLDNYNKIAFRIDSFIKKSKYKIDIYHIPPFSDDADDWCGCQMTPLGNYWETITITNIKNFKDSAYFGWDWSPSRNDLYFVKAKKENNVWKVSYLQGFKLRNYSE
jgi:hypothetical protein